MGDLETIRDGWDEAARQDAMFNILTSPDKKDGGWDPDEFFGRGAEEIDSVMAIIDERELVPERHRALDFGCGVGRLTQALANHFSYVVGLDASKEMVSRAHDWAGERGCPNVGFRTNVRPDLNVFSVGQRMDGFDLVYSVITLQHMPRELQRGYVAEFVRVLRKDGLACFQIPEGEVFEHPTAPWLSMYGTPREVVEGWVADAGGRIVAVDVSEHGGSGWKGWRYMAVRA